MTDINKNNNNDNINNGNDSFSDTESESFKGDAWNNQEGRKHLINSFKDTNGFFYFLLRMENLCILKILQETIKNH